MEGVQEVVSDGVAENWVLRCCLTTLALALDHIMVEGNLLSVVEEVGMHQSVIQFWTT
jgi:hypothetical protein